MSTAHKTVELKLQVRPASGATPEEIDRTTRRLGDDLEELGVVSAELIRAGSAPVGSKSAGVMAIGGLAVTLLPTLLPKMIDFLQSWVTRGSDEKIEVEIQAGGRTVKIKTGARTSMAEVKSLLETMMSH